MNRLVLMFRRKNSWHAGWRFTLFLAIYLAAGRALDPILARIYFPDRVFAWPSMLLNSPRGLEFVSAIAWLISRIEGERLLKPCRLRVYCATLPGAYGVLEVAGAHLLPEWEKPAGASRLRDTRQFEFLSRRATS